MIVYKVEINKLKRDYKAINLTNINAKVKAMAWANNAFKSLTVNVNYMKISIVVNLWLI